MKCSKCNIFRQYDKTCAYRLLNPRTRETAVEITISVGAKKICHLSKWKDTAKTLDSLVGYDSTSNVSPSGEVG